MATGDVEWRERLGRVSYVTGDRDVLIIVSEDVSGLDVVQRRPAPMVTAEWKEELKSQGIARKDQSDDLTIVKARCSLDKTYNITGVEMSHPGGGRLTRDRVFTQIETIMRNSDKAGGDYSVHA